VRSEGEVGPSGYDFVYVFLLVRAQKLLPGADIVQIGDQSEPCSALRERSVPGYLCGCYASAVIHGGSAARTRGFAAPLILPLVNENEKKSSSVDICVLDTVSTDVCTAS
jgi:hypothetical protein